MTPSHIINICAATFGCTREDIIGPGRENAIVLARMMAAIVIGEQFPCFKPGDIARQLSKDRGCVLHARKRWHNDNPIPFKIQLANQYEQIQTAIIQSSVHRTRNGAPRSSAGHPHAERG